MLTRCKNQILHVLYVIVGYCIALYTIRIAIKRYLDEQNANSVSNSILTWVNIFCILFDIISINKLGYGHLGSILSDVTNVTRLLFCEFYKHC